MMMADAKEVLSRGGSNPDGPEQGYHHESVRDTIESIIVALILAFVFRAFVVEAFVIPTGSMAPTLYGAHGTLLCEDCGIEFAYGVRDLDDPRRPRQILASSSAVCPNCNHVNTDLRVNDAARNAETGDRILVLKWPLDTGVGGLGPRRWDVTVFKDPADGKTNFIKRLAGLPNEVLSIIDGDVYSVATSALSQNTLDELEALRHRKYELRTNKKRGELPEPSAAVFDELDEKLRVSRKTRAAQHSLWFPVYNHDYPPKTLNSDQPRWEAVNKTESGWDATKRRVTFSDRGSRDDCITLVNKDFRASCRYNVHEQVAPPVSDLRVSFVVTFGSQTPSVSTVLYKLGRSFRATVSADGSVSILELPGDRKQPKLASLSATAASIEPGEPVEVVFENVDYRLALSVAGEEVLATSTDPTAAHYYGPNLAKLRAMRSHPPTKSPRIYAGGGDLELNHLLVQRDAFYFNDSHGRVVSWGPVDGWGGHDSPILLRGDEFFMLGDNTAASKDSRLWDVAGQHLWDRGDSFQLGTVPGDQLIGRAFFVYWPSGHRIKWAPLLNKWGVIPDVGRMRWIR